VLEQLAVDVEHGLAEHLDEPAVGVPGEAVVAAGLLGQAVHGLVVQPDVEDGLHHAGHRELRAGADADEQRVVGLAERLAHPLLHRAEVLGHLPFQAVGDRALGQVVAACLGRDREPGRDGQSEIGHFGEVCSLAAE
jgi:hypothetical protein